MYSRAGRGLCTALMCWCGPKFKLSRTLVKSLIFGQAWISVNLFAADRSLCLFCEAFLHISPGGVDRAPCSITAPEVTFHRGGWCSPWAAPILLEVVAYSTHCCPCNLRHRLPVYRLTHLARPCVSSLHLGDATWAAAACTASADRACEIWIFAIIHRFSSFFAEASICL